MAKYIDRDKLIQQIRELPEQERIEYMGIYDTIIGIPAADVKPIKRGKWHVGFDGDGVIYECTNCLKGFFEVNGENIDSVLDLNYCPKCGAKIEGSE